MRINRLSKFSDDQERPFPYTPKSATDNRLLKLAVDWLQYIFWALVAIIILLLGILIKVFVG